MARKETRKDGFWDTLKTVFWALVIAMVFRSALYQPFSIPSGSMKPTLLIGDYLFVSKFAYGYSHYSLPFAPDWFEGRIWATMPERGEGVVFKRPGQAACPQGRVWREVSDCYAKSFAEIEGAIRDFSLRARDGKLTIEEMQGGTFTITNGGVFGSLLSTPILNIPQSGILGMHKIQPRPMAMPDGAIEVRPMMYLALSYDHRIVDGREAVSFLVRVKECIEDPSRIMLDT